MTELTLTKAELIILLDSLRLFPTVLSDVVAQYCVQIRYDATKPQTWDQKYPLGLAFDGRSLYTCSTSDIQTWTLDGKQVIEKKTFTSLEKPSDIVYFNNSFYIIDQVRISMFNYQKELITTWSLPHNATLYRSLFVEINCLYVTLLSIPHIFSLLPQPGQSFTKLGSDGKGENPIEVLSPGGLAVSKNLLYVCECFSGKVKILDKDNNFTLKNSIEGLTSPYAIYMVEDIVYIGDERSVEIFLRDENDKHQLIQRIVPLDNFNEVGGIMVIKDRLYVSDYRKNRVQVFSLIN